MHNRLVTILSISALVLGCTSHISTLADERAEIAEIHVVNLPDGSTVNSPVDAHVGQVDY